MSGCGLGAKGRETSVCAGGVKVDWVAVVLLADCLSGTATVLTEMLTYSVPLSAHKMGYTNVESATCITFVIYRVAHSLKRVEIIAMDAPSDRLTLLKIVGDFLAHTGNVVANKTMTLGAANAVQFGILGTASADRRVNLAPQIAIRPHKHADEV